MYTDPTATPATVHENYAGPAPNLTVGDAMMRTEHVRHDTAADVASLRAEVTALWCTLVGAALVAGAACFVLWLRRECRRGSYNPTAAAGIGRPGA